MSHFDSASQRHGVYIAFIVNLDRGIEGGESEWPAACLQKGEELLESALNFNQLWSASLDNEVEGLDE